MKWPVSSASQHFFRLSCWWRCQCVAQSLQVRLQHSLHPAVPAVGSKFWLWVKTLISVEPDRSGRHSMSTVALAAGAPPQKDQGMTWKQVRRAPEGAEFEGFEAGLLQSHRFKLIAFSQSESFFQTLSVLLNAKILAVGTCTNTVTATEECNGSGCDGQKPCVWKRAVPCLDSYINAIRCDGKLLEQVEETHLKQICMWPNSSWANQLLSFAWLVSCLPSFEGLGESGQTLCILAEGKRRENPSHAQRFHLIQLIYIDSH